MIKEKLNFAWDTTNGIAAWTLNEILFDKMKKSGCYKVNLALESGSQYVLNNIIKKPLNLEKVKPLARYAKKIGLDVGIFLIMGLPGETESQMKESFKLAAELGIWHPFVSVATPYPGSELYDICLRKGYLNKNFSLDDLFIRSFSISTEDWDGARLKEIFKEGRKFLLLSYLKSQPLKFFI